MMSLSPAVGRKRRAHNHDYVSADLGLKRTRNDALSTEKPSYKETLLVYEAAPPSSVSGKMDWGGGVRLNDTKE